MKRRDFLGSGFLSLGLFASNGLAGQSTKPTTPKKQQQSPRADVLPRLHQLEDGGS
jgi:hypothetical protein